MHAVLSKNLGMVQALLKIEQTNLNAASQDGKTALMFAAESGALEISEVLLKRGANLALRDNDDFTALILATRNGHKEIVILLLKNLFNSDDLNEDNLGSFNASESQKQILEDTEDNSKNALMYAVQYGHMDILKMLLSLGVDINHEDLSGNNVITLALDSGNVDILSILLTPEIYRIHMELDLNELHNGQSLLNIMAKRGNDDYRYAIQKCLLKGANPNVPDENGNTALMLSIIHSSEEAAREILSSPAVDLAAANLRNREGKSALMLACQKRFEGIIRTLIRMEVDIHVVDTSGRSALDYAINANLPRQIIDLLRPTPNSPHSDSDKENEDPID